MKAFISILVVACVAMSSANAALVGYRFTAQFNQANLSSSGLPSTSFAARGAQLQTISGIFSYDSASPQTGFGVTTAGYAGAVSILLDQFSTINLGNPTNSLIIDNDSAGYRFVARDTPPSMFANQFLDATWFRFDANSGIFSGLALPTSLSLNDFLFGSITLVTRDSNSPTLNFANFLIDSLSPVRSVPIPAAPILFLSGIGVFGWMRRRSAAAA